MSIAPLLTKAFACPLLPISERRQESGFAAAAVQCLSDIGSYAATLRSGRP